MTPAARELLRSGEALVLDWHRLAVCCAGAGELGLYAMKEKGGREVNLDARKVLGLRRFSSDLPGDFGLRAVMGCLPEPDNGVR